MNYRQLSDFKIESLEEQIIWKEERKEFIKGRIQGELGLNPKNKRFKLNWEWIKVPASVVSVGLLCFVLIANLSKSDIKENQSANPGSYTWHNLEIKPVMPSSDANWGEIKDLPSIISNYKNFDIVESQKRASFQIMRPTFDLHMPLELSRGVITYPSSLSADNFNGPLTYWDIWHKGDYWVSVKQSLADDSKQLLSKTGKKVTWKVNANAKVISLKDKDAIAIMMDESDKAKRVMVYVQNNNEQVILLQIRGNISEKKLMELAKSYLN